MTPSQRLDGVLFLSATQLVDANPCRAAITRMRPKGDVMAEQGFRAGQKVTFVVSFPIRSAAGGGYVVTRQLPQRDGEFEYRIKSISEPHERVVRESELARE